MRSAGSMALRVAVAGFAGLGLLWLSISVTAVNVFRDVQPETALAFWPGDGFALANLAESRLSSDLSAPSREFARSQAARALAAEPTAASAARTLAAISASDAIARRRFGYARRLSRRDLGTNLYFIEDAVRRNDVPASLEQYDIALRTSQVVARQLLFPILDSALGDPQLTGPIGHLLARGGDWAPEFVDFSAGQRTHAVALARALVLNPAALSRVADESKIRLIGTLADQNAFGLADAIFRQAGHPTPPHTIVRDGGFDHTGYWAPFDWALSGGGDYGGSINTQDGVLEVYSGGTSGGTIARQLVRLPAGANRLTVVATIQSGGDATPATWTLSCAGAQPRTLAQLAVNGPIGARRQSAAAFSAPSGCTWAWLSLAIGGVNQGGRYLAQIDSVSIDPA